MRKLFYFLSKTDLRAISLCNSRSRMHQQSLGIFVLVTAMFAFLSCYYALTTIFGVWDEINQTYFLSIKSKLIIVVYSFLYGTAIGLIDREIVSSRNKKAVLLRIPLAIMIGLIISVPIKLKVLDGRINQQIKDEYLAKMMPMKNSKDLFIASADSIIGNYELQLNYYIQMRNNAQKRVEAEDLGYQGAGLTGLRGQGKFYDYALAEVRNYSQIIDELKEKIEEKKVYRTERLEQMERDFNVYKPNVTYDLWTKYQAMHTLVKQDESGQARSMVWGLSLLFIMLELIPALIKLMSPDEEYDMMIGFQLEAVKIKLGTALKIIEKQDTYNDYILLPEIQIA